MLLSNLLKESNMSIYECSKRSGIPYSTLSDLVRGKKPIEKCSAEMVYKLAKALDTSVEYLIEECHVPERPDFELFKSNVCHDIRRKGDLDFIFETIKSQTVQRFWEIKWYLEAMYLIGILDYLCRINNIPKCDEYEEYRNYKMESLIYPRSVKYEGLIGKSDRIKNYCEKNAIPELLKFNIIEGDIRNVI